MNHLEFSEADFPALYVAADELSASTQRLYLILIKAYLALLVLAAAISVFSFQIVSLKIISALIYVAVIVLTIASYATNLNKRWYSARAIAESVKTLTWRFMMCADPYPASKSGVELVEAFLANLKLMFQQNQEIAKYLPGTHIGKSNVTPRMLEVRKSTYQSRLALYVTKRIDDQLDWYQRKTVFNRSRALRWFVAVVTLLSLAVAGIIIGLATDNLLSLFSQVLSTAVACSLTWIQIKRYDDLTAAYNLTANEIGFIKSLSLKVKSEQHLNEFVSDSENAFSREHTQWVARRDH